MSIKKKRKREIIGTYPDRECRRLYDDIFGTEGGFVCCVPDGLVAYDPESNKSYFCLYEDKDAIIDRCWRSLESGRNLFAEEWIEWKGYEEGVIY